MPSVLASDASGASLARRYSDAADAWIANVAGAPPPGVALVAVGSYGRRQLCPGSDIDLLLLHRAMAEREVGRIAEAIWYPLWDTGVRLDHSVRSLRQALRLADQELAVAVGLLDARCVWGDADLAADLRDGVRDLWSKGGRRRLPELAQSVAARHATAGEVAFLLEPDLKEGRGGLRDVVALQAAVAGSPVVPPLDQVMAAADVVLGVRAELHRKTGRTSNRLVLEEQDGVAAALDYPNADLLIADLARAARTVTRYSDDAWRRVASWVEGPKGRQASADRPLGPGLVLRDDEVVIAADSGDPAQDPSLLWRAACASAERGVPLARRTVERLQAEQPVQTERWSPAMRDAFVALLGTGREAVPVFEALDEAGLIVRVIPEWGPVRNRPQRNAFHRFTVDRHLCETAAEAAVLVRRVRRPDLLLVGSLLHDIGKGYPGDHSEVGVRIVADLATRMGFDPSDVDALTTMVRHHLLLPDVASRRDIDDPATIEAVAAEVGSIDRLELLAALAEADGRATGPAAWGAWKAGLVEKLATRVRLVLGGQTLEPLLPPFPRALAAVPPSLRPAVDRAIADGSTFVGVTGEGPLTVAVATADRPGLLARLSDAFAVHRLAVLSALCADAGDGHVLDVFVVEHQASGPLDRDQFAADVERALDGRLPVEPVLAERDRAYATRRRQAAQPAGREIRFEEAPGSTVVEVRAPDATRLLHRIAAAFAQCGLDVRSAKVATLGHEVVDTFSVTAGGGPVAPDRWTAIEAALLERIG